MANVIITGIDDAIKTFGVINTFEFLRKPLQRWAFRIQAELATYPQPIPSGLFMSTATEKQKRAFFALLSSGLIPKNRTGELGRSWTTSVRVEGLTIKAEVGTNLKYARFVQGEDIQPFHSGRWETTDDVLDRNRNKIIEDIEKEIKKII